MMPGHYYGKIFLFLFSPKQNKISEINKLHAIHSGKEILVSEFALCMTLAVHKNYSYHSRKRGTAREQTSSHCVEGTDLKGAPSPYRKQI